MANIINKLKSVFSPTYVVSINGDAPSGFANYSAKRLYQTQDNVKAVVDFLAASLAQLPLKCYIRQAEDKRTRDRKSPAAQLLYTPNPDQTCFEFIRDLATEYYVFGAVYVWVIQDKSTPSGYQLRLIPTEWVRKSEQDSVYSLKSITVNADGSGSGIVIPSSDFLRFSTCSPGNPGGFVAPMAALRDTLREQVEATRYRHDLWRSSGRLNAQIIRPKDVAPWDEATRKRWITEFRKSWGSGGSKAGSIPLMEDGMEIKPFQTNFKEQQWLESVKLSREAVAAAFRINPSLVWHSDTQTYASSKDNARALYAECLGPDIQMFQQRINSFLLPMLGADPNMYVEFDLNEKLKGSFEERASVTQSAVGGPWMTRNEARADNNLPPVDGGDELIVPLNVITGGQASPQDTHMNQNSGCCHSHKSKAADIRIKAASSEAENEALEKVLSAFIERQAKSVIPKLGSGKSDWWDAERWNRELAKDMTPVLDEISDSHGIEAAKELKTEYIPELTRKYLEAMAAGRAKTINEKTKKAIDEALESDDEDVTPAAAFESRKTDSAIAAKSAALAAAYFGSGEAVTQAVNAGNKYKKIEKEWVTGPNARESHQLMNGQRVPVDQYFSNGQYWPGDDNADPDESCGCNCTTQIIVEM